MDLDITARDDIDSGHSYWNDSPAPLMGGWQPLDLATYTDGTHVPEEATLLLRADGVGLLYPGKVHAFNGEPESAKSMLGQHAIAVELMAGHYGLVLDYESDASTYVERLLAMGVTPEAIVRHRVYVNPETDPVHNAVARSAFDALIDSRPFTLAIVDGVTEALTMMGGATNSGDDTTLWHRMVPRRIAQRSGAAVAVVDHVTKSTESRGRFAIGSQSKLAALTGAAYLVDVKEPLGRGRIGEVVLKVAKDRPGYVRGNAGVWNASTRLQDAARVTVDGTLAGRITITVNPPQMASSGDWKPTRLMERISTALEQSTNPLSFRALKAHVGGKEDNLRAAIGVLVKDGNVATAPGPHNATLHTLVRPYVEADELPGDSQRLSTVPVTVSTVSLLRDGGEGDSEGMSQGDSGETLGDSRSTGPNLAILDTQTRLGRCRHCGDPLDRPALTQKCRDRHEATS